MLFEPLLEHLQPDLKPEDKPKKGMMNRVAPKQPAKGSKNKDLPQEVSKPTSNPLDIEQVTSGNYFAHKLVGIAI